MYKITKSGYPINDQTRATHDIIQIEMIDYSGLIEEIYVFIKFILQILNDFD